VSHVVTLLSKPGCHLCDDAREAVARISAELGVEWSERDITADPADYAEYGDRIPVILIDGSEHCYWTVEEERLRAALAR
jgi:glutaredoxin